MSIGQKIKELRRKNDLTQEKLADLLGVSFQAVSKWETDVASPDLSLIVPLSRLFHVSTDELFGVDGENARRAEFDEAYENYWQKDHNQMYAIARQAVSEFPGDYKYLCWLASMEYYTAFDDEYQSGGDTERFNALMEQARKHYDRVIEGCADAEIRQEALFGIIQTLKQLNDLPQARKYAELFPEKQGYTRDEMLETCTEGEDRLTIRQRIVFEKTKELLAALRRIWQNPPEINRSVREALDISEGLIELTVSDGNYLRFYWDLYQLYLARAEVGTVDRDYEKAVEHLATAKEYAIKRDFYNANGKQKYSCPIFDHLTDDLSCELLPNDSLDCWEETVKRKVFDPLRNRKDFRELLS